MKLIQLFRGLHEERVFPQIQFRPITGALGFSVHYPWRKLVLATFLDNKHTVPTWKLPISHDHFFYSSPYRMAVTLYAALNPEMCLLPIVVWGMISWGRSQKKGMIIYYQCDSTLDVQLLQPPNQSILWQISEAASTPVSHLTLSLALAFWFAFGLHPPVNSRNAFPFVPCLVFPPERYSCRTEII